MDYTLLLSRYLALAFTSWKHSSFQVIFFLKSSGLIEHLQNFILHCYISHTVESAECNYGNAYIFAEKQILLKKNVESISSYAKIINDGISLKL